MNNRSNLIIQLLANCMPLIGYWLLDWNMFAIIYLYWAEGLIIAFYSCARIAMAKGAETISKEPDKPVSRISSAVKYFILRVFIHMFYWIFIFAFVANPGGGVGLPVEIAKQNYMILFFLDREFNNILLVIILSQLIIFISGYIARDEYKRNPSSKYKTLFDSRTIVLHIVIVLGTFSYQFLQKYESYENKLPALSYVLIFFIIKSLTDIFHYKFSGSNDINAGNEKNG